MKVTLNWLKEYVNIESSPEHIAELLTMVGLEVEALEKVGAGLEKIVAGKILEVKPHPRADKLFVCKVDNGQKPISVVCGAPNVREGIVAPLALPGIELPNGVNIREAEIRGEKSEAVLLAEDELGLSEDHSGIMVLPDDTIPGLPLSKILPVEDWVLEIGLTPNRPDCASVIGIAREIAAVTRHKVMVPPVHLDEKGPDIGTITSVTIEDEKGCPRYCARVIQKIKIAPSPFWLRYRLHLCGIRSINNVVDVTNYVLLETGQPLHAFDLNRLRENRIVVKRADDGSVFTTLDGESRKLSKEILLIWDGQRPVALAGIMGGLNSEIFEGTEDVLLESAFFDPITIRRGAKYLGLSTEASYRFERGVDIEGVPRALDRATSLIQQLCGGQVAKGILDIYPSPYESPLIKIRASESNRILGTDLGVTTLKEVFSSLEMDVKDIDDDTLEVRPPSFRVDIHREIDLVEEVARMTGYDNIPVTQPKIRASEEREARELTIRDRVRSILVGMGFSEIITYSFISPEMIKKLGEIEGTPLTSFVELLNPLTIEQSVMRTSLLPGLLQTARHNFQHGERELKLFEWGKVFFSRGKEVQPEERLFLAGLMSGIFRQKMWYNEERDVDFFDIKGSLDGLLRALGVDASVYERNAKFPGYDPEVSALVIVGGQAIGRLGKVGGHVLEAYDIEKRKVFVFELDIEALLKVVPDIRRFVPFAKFPAVYRDISMVVPRELESADIIAIINREGKGLVESVDIFDVYEGKGIKPSEKALAFRVCYRSKEGTLDGEYVNSIHESIIRKIGEETGGRLREG